MPARFARKQYRKNAYYHVYNRGASKTEIFIDEEDFLAFRNIARQELFKLYPNIQLIAFCLMPNHFHLLIYQSKERCITKLMTSLGIRYSMYFNKRHDRSGRLCQGEYRGVVRAGKELVRQTHNYILQNPQEAGLSSWEHVGWII